MPRRVGAPRSETVADSTILAIIVPMPCGADGRASGGDRGGWSVIKRSSPAGIAPGGAA
jgi:hypothetical protein